MFEAMAGAIMATKIHFSQMKYPFMKKNDRVVAEEIYKNEVNKLEEEEKYEKSKLPESGYMTVEEYEAKSRAKSQKELCEELKGGELPKDSNMVYVPQRSFKLVKYNEPVGSPELSLPRKLNFDRQINAQGIISGDRTMMVYPSVYYYAQSDCTSCDLFLIKLDPKLSDTDKARYANIVQKVEKPLISTEKDINTRFIFRTLTPIDFSTDNKKLVVKEKVGHRHDGIWKTDIWVYDFETQEALKLSLIREAIMEYWAQTSGVDFEENRWDIYPMGFDANNNDRIILCAYAYTGEVPKFLGTWSVDVKGENSKLEDLEGSDFPVSVVGYKLAEDNQVRDISEVEFEAKQAEEKEKAKEKETKSNEKFNRNIQKIEYQRKIHQMDMETYLKIQQRRQQMKEWKKNTKSHEGLTGAN
jgi:hypothetical protein